MDITHAFTADETRCDTCGHPTPHLEPRQDIELCDACLQAQAPHFCPYCGGESVDDDTYCSERCLINAADDNEGGF